MFANSTRFRQLDAEPGTTMTIGFELDGRGCTRCKRMMGMVKLSIPDLEAAYHGTATP